MIGIEKRWYKHLTGLTEKKKEQLRESALLSSRKRSLINALRPLD